MEEIIYSIYEKTGACITGTQKRARFYIVFAIIFLIIIFLSLYFKKSNSSENLYWIFSSTVQSLVALVSFFGVLVIFKYQNISSYEEQILDKLQEGNGSPLAVLGGRLDAINISELIKNIKNVIGNEKNSEMNEGLHGNRLRKLLDNLRSKGRLKKYLYEFVIKFSVYTFGIVILNLILMVLTPYIVRCYLGFPISFLSIFLTGYALFMAIKIIAETLIIYE